MITKSEKIISLETEIQELQAKCRELNLKYAFYLQDEKIYRYYIDLKPDGISRIMQILEPKYRAFVDLIARKN